MKRFSYFLLLVLAVAVGGLFLLKESNGNAELHLDRLMLKTQQSVTELKSLTIDNIEIPNFSDQQSKDVDVYMWVDDKGVTHYTDKPNQNAEKLVLDPYTVVEAEEPVWPKKEEKTKLQKKSSSSDDYFSRMQNLKTDAEAVKKQLEQRNKVLEKELNNL